MAIHSWRVYCQCRGGSCLGEQFSRELQAAVPEAEQSAGSEQACLKPIHQFLFVCLF